MSRLVSPPVSTDRPELRQASGFDRLLGLNYTALSADRVEATLEVTEPLLQPFGLLHGGVLCTIVESLGSIGGSLWFGDRGSVVGVANATDFLRATRLGATLTAVATPVHRGRTQQLWQIEIRDEAGKLVARGQLRVANIDDPARLGGR